MTIRIPVTSLDDKGIATHSILEIDEVDYAIRGNADLGVKETGKTFASMWFAERLTPHQLRILANTGASRTTSNVISALVSAGLVRRDGKDVVLRDIDER